MVHSDEGIKCSRILFYVDGDARNEVLTGVAKLRMVPESREYGRHLVQPSPGRRK